MVFKTRWLKLKKKKQKINNNKTKNCENELLQLSCGHFLRTPIFLPSGLSAYCHGNVDFRNVWERCWPARTITHIHISVVCSLKSMCIPSFILIGCCVSELHVPIVMYGLRLVLQELQCLHVSIIRPVSTTSQNFVSHHL